MRQALGLCSAIVVFSACPGPKGDIGPQGPQGLQGAAGVQGTQGPPGPAGLTSLLYNSSFEHGLDGFTVNAAGGANTATIDSAMFHDGTQAVHLVSNGSAGNVGIATPYIPVVPGARLTVSVWLKGNNVQTGSCGWCTLYGLARFHSRAGEIDAGGPASCEFSRAGTFDWTQLTATCTVPDNAVYWRGSNIGIVGDGRGEAWIDQLTVTIDNAPAPTTVSGRLVDSGRFAATFSNAYYYNTTVQFSRAFATPPTVVCSELSGAGNWIFCKTDSVTTTSATFAVRTLDGANATYSTNIGWIAVGY